MTITETEIRTALQRAVERADLQGAPSDAPQPARTPDPRRAWPLIVAAAAVIAVLVVGAALARGGTDHVQTQQTPAGDPDVATTSTLPTATTEPTATTTPAPGDVRVLVLNGSGTSGAAALLGGSLTQAGYEVLPPNNAPRQFDATVVYFAPGFGPAADELAIRIGAPVIVHLAPELEDLASANDADVVIVVGGS